ncbi:MAG TPA: hypothetical protein ENI95_15460 [Chloroflexi bacterium]|nr:hypothetical protein [Chloroflexota bacterium]
MVRALVESFLGPIGVQILYFYEEHSLFINSIVLIYGFVMVFSWVNLSGIRKRLIGAMVDQMREHPDIHAGAKIKRVLREIEIPWESVIDERRYPFVAPQMALWPRRKSVEVVKALLSPEELAAEALEELASLASPPDSEADPDG